MLILALWTVVFVLHSRRHLSGWEEAIPVGIGLSQACLVILSNMVLRSGGWAHWPWMMVFVVAALAVFLVLPRRSHTQPTLPADGRIYLLALACLWVAWWGQGLVHDDDYLAHGSIQGQLLKGDFPPRNPWFPELTLHGHYARSLLVVLWAKMTGFSLPTAQFLLTNLLQPLLPILGYWAIYRWKGDRLVSFWGTCFLTLGVRVGDRAGFLDTFQNNNSLAQLFFVLSLYFFCCAWRRQSWLDACCLGLILGGYAAVYETQFGLACLASLASFSAGLVWHPRRKLLIAQGLLVVVAALSLACTQGGPLTDLAQRRFQSQAKPDDSLAYSSQAQHVELKFPKALLGQIRSASTSYASAEARSPSAWVYRSNLMLDPSDGYQYFWHPNILGLHHFPLLLSPFLLILALKRRDALSLWLVSFGICGFFVPAVVDFGPVFESEWFRWQYCAGLPLAGAMGIWAAPWIKAALSKCNWTSLLVVLLLLFCSSNVWKISLHLAHLAQVRWSLGQSIYAGGYDYLTSQPQFFCRPADYEALSHLNRQSRRGQRVLINFPEEHWPNINFAATMSSLTGLYPSGNRKPFESDLIGQWPFRLRADARAFWQSGDLRLLEMRPVDWIYWRPDPEFATTIAPQAISGVAWRRFEDRWLGQVQIPWTPRNWQTIVEPLAVEAQIEGPAHARGGSCYPAVLRLINNARVPLAREQGRILLMVGEDPEDWLLVPLEQDLQPGQRARQEFILAVPHQDKTYSCRAAWVGSEGRHPLLGETPIRVDFTKSLCEMELISQEHVGPAQAGSWLHLRSRWECPQLEDETQLQVRVGLAALVDTPESAPLETLQSGTQVGQAAYPPALNQQSIEFRRVPGSATQWQLDAWTLTPDAPGPYRMDWFFSPAYAQGVRRRGQSLTLEAPRR